MENETQAHERQAGADAPETETLLREQLRAGSRMLDLFGYGGDDRGYDLGARISELGNERDELREEVEALRATLAKIDHLLEREEGKPGTVDAVRALVLIAKPLGRLQDRVDQLSRPGRWIGDASLLAGWIQAAIKVADKSISSAGGWKAVRS